MQLHRLCLGLAVFAVAAGTASAARQPKIVSQAQLAEYWQVGDGAPAPRFRLKESPFGDVCVALGYRIKADGTTADFSLLKAWGSANPDVPPADDKIPALIQAAAGAASQRHYTSTVKDGEAKEVYTSGTFVFLASETSDPAKIGGNCDIADLKSFVADAQAKAYRRGNMNKANEDQSRRDYTPTDAATLDVQRRLNARPR